MNRIRAAVMVCCAALLFGCHPDLAVIERQSVDTGRPPAITPDYAGITLPPNIAPLNFILRDSCAACAAVLSSVNGTPVVAWGDRGDVRIPAKPWKRLLAQNAGKPLQITLYARDGGGTWHRYAPIEDTIAPDAIDRYCTYRLLSYLYNYSRSVRECQRDLTGFTETVLLDTRHYAWGCTNCHMPLNNDPSRFVLQSRSKEYGSETLIADSGRLTTLSSRLGYASWHPGGRYIAFSVYKVEQYFHTVGRQFIDVFDRNSCIVLYDAAARSIVPAPQLDLPGVLETWPAWSADGRYLYFCSSPVPWRDATKKPPDSFNLTKYSLLRIAYDAGRNAWGAVDTVLSSRETGLSIAQPRISPDNRFCLFCMQDHGAYPHAQVSSDLYLMEIATRNYRKLPVNSDYSESWHSWSQNGRWILFSSKRGGGIFTRLYFSYVDPAGTAHKPFLLPQRSGAFYDSFIECYNVPELAVAPVHFSERRLLKAITSRHRVTVPIPVSAAAPSAESSPAWGAPPAR